MYMEVGRGARRAVLLAVVAGIAGNCLAEGYALQAGAYGTIEEANQQAQRLQSQWSPVRIAQIPGDSTGYPYKVRVGHFAVYAEAYAVQKSVSSSALPGAFIVKHQENPSAPVRTPVSTVNTSGLADADPANVADYWGAAGLIPPEATEFATETAIQLESAITLNPTGEESNSKRLRLARKYAKSQNFSRVTELLGAVKSGGNVPEQVMADFVAAHADLHRNDSAAALEKFRGLAGNTAVPPGIRREALRRAGGLMHKLRRYPDAWLTFGQVAEFATRPSDRAEARMQQAGLAFELVGCGKGTWEEVRALCEVVISDPDAPRKIKATAALMHLETFWEEGQDERTCAAAEAFLAQYADIGREAVMARLWLGLARFRSGDLTGAREALELAFNESGKVSEKFGGTEPRAYAAAWLAFIARKQGDAPRCDYWKRLVYTEFPQSKEAAQLGELLGA